MEPLRPHFRTTMTHKPKSQRKAKLQLFLPAETENQWAFNLSVDLTSKTGGSNNNSNNNSSTHTHTHTDTHKKKIIIETTTKKKNGGGNVIIIYLFFFSVVWKREGKLSSSRKATPSERCNQLKHFLLHSPSNRHKKYNNNMEDVKWPYQNVLFFFW